MMRKLSFPLFYGLTAILVIGSALLLVLFVPPFEQARVLANHLSKDGSMDMFTLPMYQTGRVPALIGAGVSLLLTALIVVNRRMVLNWIESVLALQLRFWRDGRIFLNDLRCYPFTRSETVFLVGLILLAIAARVPFLMQPYEHDEAYTVVNFVAANLREGLSNYHLPNNHLFHTLLAHFAYRIWGYQPWAIRLPAMIAGVLGVPLTYLLARALYERKVAWIAAAGAAALPVLVYYATNARGYTLVIDFTLLIALLAVYVRQRANLAAWILFVLFSTLGVYTIPIFLYPLGAVMAWLFLSLLIGDVGAVYGRWGMLKWLIAAGAATAALSVLLYLPIFFRFDVQPLFFTDLSKPKMPWSDFFGDAQIRLIEDAGHLVMGIPPVFGVLMGIGFVLSLIPQVAPAGASPYARWRVPFQLAALGWTAGLVVVMRSEPYARFFIFCVPLLLIWAAAGWVGLFNLLGKWKPCIPFTAALVGLVAVGSIAGTGWRVAAAQGANLGAPGDVEKVAIFLQSQLKDKDLVVVNVPHDAQLWYYSRLHGTNPDHFKRELPFFRAFVLVDSSFSQTLQSVIQDRGPESYFFDFSTAKRVYQSGAIQVIEVYPYQDLIRKEYHLP